MLLLPLSFAAVQWSRGHLRLQFGIGALFGLITTAAVGFAIARLDWPWPVEAGLIWTLLICAVGWASRRRMPRA